jgi:hypothetical protein
MKNRAFLENGDKWTDTVSCQNLTTVLNGREQLRPENMGRVRYPRANFEEKTYVSSQALQFPSQHLSLSATRHLPVVLCIKSMKSNLCTALTSWNERENNSINSHANMQLHCSPVYFNCC